MSRTLHDEPIMVCPNCGQPHMIKVNDSELYDDPFIHYEKKSAQRRKIACETPVERKVRGENGEIEMKSVSVTIRVPKGHGVRTGHRCEDWRTTVQ